MPEISQSVLSPSAPAPQWQPAPAPARTRSPRRAGLGDSRATPPVPTVHARLAPGVGAFLRPFSRGAVALLNGLIWVYQHTVSPAFAVAFPSCGCRFAPTCSHYAQDALRKHGLLRGLALTARRLAKCGPWHPGGFDPVPSSPLPHLERRKRFSCRAVLPDSSLITRHSPLS